MSRQTDNSGTVCDGIAGGLRLRAALHRPGRSPRPWPSPSAAPPSSSTARRWTRSCCRARRCSRSPFRFGIERAEYTIGASGCGKRASYVVICPDQPGSTCFAAAGRDGILPLAEVARVQVRLEVRRVQRLAAGAQRQFVGGPAAGLAPDVVAQPVEHRRSGRRRRCARPGPAWRGASPRTTAPRTSRPVNSRGSSRSRRRSSARPAAARPCSCRACPGPAAPSSSRPTAPGCPRPRSRLRSAGARSRSAG